MTVGLLVCDHVDKQVQSKFEDYPDMFQNLFPELDFRIYDAINGEFPQDLSNECDAYMATGSQYSVYQDIKWINNLKEVIRAIHALEIKFVGYCFGHQLLAEALGGRVAKSENGWTVGVHSFAIQSPKPWMDPNQTTLDLLMMCQDQVSHLPPNSELLAGNSQCPIGVFQVGKNAIGMQAHPEFTSDYDRYLIEKRRERIGNDSVEKGLSSLNQEVDKKLIHDWVLNFINQKDDQ